MSKIKTMLESDGFHAFMALLEATKEVCKVFMYLAIAAVTFFGGCLIALNGITGGTLWQLMAS